LKDVGSGVPVVVGVNWILECLQQGCKVDETNFLVEVGKQAIFQKVGWESRAEDIMKVS
jgi:hypothetical protein